MIRFRATAFAAACLLHGAAAHAQAVAKEGTPPGGLAGSTPPAPSADKCFSCHAGSADDTGALFRPFDTWGGTMMANAMRDPLFLAALTVAEQDVAGSGQYCLRCHTPKGFVKGNATGIGKMLDADDLEGVDCEGCHRSVNGRDALPELMHDGDVVAGRAALDPAAPYIGNARLIWDPRDVRHGPYADADSPAHAASSSAFGSSSEFCGQCHELMSPTRTLHELDGTDTGIPFPLDTTYTEWKSSAYAAQGASAKTCIDCHMQRAVGSELKLSTYGSAVPREAPRTHLLVGSNEWSVEAVMKANPELALDRQDSFEAVKAATRNLLASAISVELSATPIQAGATSASVTVKVTNLSGHKFPTGYADGRRAFLQVEINDASGASLGLVGRYDAATQSLVNEPGLRVWEAVQAEQTANGEHHEWHIVKNDVVVKDTRIPPLGFAPAEGKDRRVTLPVGADYGAPGATRNYDQVTVALANLAPLPQAPLHITARVFYQSTTREFITELAAANKTDQRSADLSRVYQQTGNAAPRLVKQQSIDVQVGPMVAGSGGAGGAGGSPAASAGAPTAGTAPTTGKSDDGGCALSRPPIKKSPAIGILLFAIGSLTARRRRNRPRPDDRGTQRKAHRARPGDSSNPLRG